MGHGEEFSFYPKSSRNLLMGFPVVTASPWVGEEVAFQEKAKLSWKKIEAKRLGGAGSKC